jgi:quinol monooxygenase YgiN
VGQGLILRVAVIRLGICNPVAVDSAAQDNTNLGLVVRFALRPGCEHAFDDLVASTVAAIEQHEPGTLLYVTHAVEDEPRTRIFYELYRDRAAFEAHEQQPHTRHFLTEREHLVESFTVDWLRPTAQAGVTRAHP